MKYNENQLDNYSEPLSKTEEELCKNAIDMVKNSLIEGGYTITKSRANYSVDGYAYYYEFSQSNFYSLTLLIQGSYANNTNIKRYSDVDMSVIYRPYLPYNLNEDFPRFKTRIFEVLRKTFGSNVVRKNKSIRIEGNTDRKSIDIVPAYSINYRIENGIQFLTDKGELIKNYPIKQIINENQKNEDTNYNFKRCVRILKNIRMDMKNDHFLSAEKIGSFQLESLIWNLDDSIFNKHYSKKFIIEDIIEELKKNKFYLNIMKESNGIKPLCPTDESRLDMENFINQLYIYYDYEV